MSIILPNLTHSFICPVPVPVACPDSVSGLAYFSIRPLPALQSQTSLIKHVTFLSHGRAAKAINRFPILLVFTLPHLFS